MSQFFLPPKCGIGSREQLPNKLHLPIDGYKKSPARESNPALRGLERVSLPTTPPDVVFIAVSTIFHHFSRRFHCGYPFFSNYLLSLHPCVACFGFTCLWLLQSSLSCSIWTLFVIVLSRALTLHFVCVSALPFMRAGVVLC